MYLHMSDRVSEGSLPIGINTLDEQYLNGIPKGSTIAVVGPSQGPTTQFLAQMASTRKTMYFTTGKPKSVVEYEAKLTSSRFESEQEVPEDLTIKEKYKSDQGMAEYIREEMSELGEEENLVIDNFSSVWDEIEDETEYYSLTRDLYETTESQGGITFIYFLGDGYGSLSKAEQQVLNICDGVFLFETEVLGQEVKTDLNIYKLRGIGDTKRTVFRLKTGSKIIVDSSQEIN